jgi:hypothetical protein
LIEIKLQLIVSRDRGNVEDLQDHQRGPVEFGEDLMTIDIGDTIAVRRFTPTPK